MYNQALISRDQISFNVYNQETKYHITNKHLLESRETKYHITNNHL